MEESIQTDMGESTRNQISEDERNAIIDAMRPSFARQRVQSVCHFGNSYQDDFADSASVSPYQFTTITKLQAARICMAAPLTMEEYLENEAKKQTTRKHQRLFYDGANNIVTPFYEGGGVFTYTTFPNFDGTHYCSGTYSKEEDTVQMLEAKHDIRIRTHGMISLRPDGTKFISVSKAHMITPLAWQRPSVEIRAFKGQITGCIDNATEGLRRSRSVPNLTTSVIHDRNGNTGVVTTLNGSSKADTVLSIVE